MNIKTLIKASNYQQNGDLYGVVSYNEGFRQDFAVIFISGFERFGPERKWRVLSDKLSQKGVLNVQFDCTGLGLSEGEYNNPSVEHMLIDLKSIMDEIENVYKISVFHIVGHSLGACVALSAYKKYIGKIYKLVLLAPALDQSSLNRYRFVMNTKKDQTITRDNYIDYLNEQEYENYTSGTQLKKYNIIHSDYLKRTSEVNYNKILDTINKGDVFIVSGLSDKVVPIGSFSNYKDTLIIPNGDHDLEKPGIIEQRVDKVIDFIIT